MNKTPEKGIRVSGFLFRWPAILDSHLTCHWESRRQYWCFFLVSNLQWCLFFSLEVGLKLRTNLLVVKSTLLVLNGIENNNGTNIDMSSSLILQNHWLFLIKINLREGDSPVGDPRTTKILQTRWLRRLNHNGLSFGWHPRYLAANTADGF